MHIVLIIKYIKVERHATEILLRIYINQSFSLLFFLNLLLSSIVYATYKLASVHGKHLWFFHAKTTQAYNPIWLSYLISLSTCKLYAI